MHSISSLHHKLSLLCVLSILSAAPAVYAASSTAPGAPAMPASIGAAGKLPGPGTPLGNQLGVPLGNPPEGLPLGAPPEGLGNQSFNQGSAAATLTKAGVYRDQKYQSKEQDQNALRVTGRGVTLEGVRVDKAAGDSTSTEQGDFYGLNAAVLATDGAHLSVVGGKITSSAKNGNGLFSYGEGTQVLADHVTIRTTGNNSGGIQTTGGGTTKATGLDLATTGDSSAAIRSDRGGGTVNVTGGRFTTSGYGSPAIYSTAAITVTKAKLQAKNSEGAVIEGMNQIQLKDCELEGNMPDVRVMGPNTIREENVHTVMIYQSMSGDAEEGTSDFAMTGGRLISHRGDVIYVTNTSCHIDLSGVEIENHGDGALLRIVGNSGKRGWGKAGSNGGQATVTATNQKLKGDMVVDSISHLDLTLNPGTEYKGAIILQENNQGSTQESGIDVTIAKGAVWKLTGDSTVSSLDNQGRIDTNGHKLTVLDD